MHQLTMFPQPSRPQALPHEVQCSACGRTDRPDAAGIPPEGWEMLLLWDEEAQCHTITRWCPDHGLVGSGRSGDA